jgi:hypothetical protein
MASNPVWEICERMAEVQALLHDHTECGKHTAADVVVKAQAVLSESALLRAMFDVGYFPPNTPPGGSACRQMLIDAQPVAHHNRSVVEVIIELSLP